MESDQDTIVVSRMVTNLLQDAFMIKRNLIHLRFAEK